MSGYVPCDFTPGQTVRYCQGFGREERTVVRVVERAHHLGMDTWADGLVVEVGGRESGVLMASWFEAVE